MIQNIILIILFTIDLFLGVIKKYNLTIYKCLAVKIHIII